MNCGRMNRNRGGSNPMGSAPGAIRSRRQSWIPAQARLDDPDTGYVDLSPDSLDLALPVNAESVNTRAYSAARNLQIRALPASPQRSLLP